MGFGNGYDSGYSDAIDDVRSGKVPGVGPASGGGEPVPSTRSPGLFFLYASNEDLETEIAMPDACVVFYRQVTGVSVDLAAGEGGYSVVATASAPGGGWVPGDIVFFQHNQPNLSVDLGDTVPVLDSVGNPEAAMRGLALVRRTSEWILVPLGSFG